jgi:hypothetical protein
MISDSDILIKLHKEAIAFLQSQREDDEEEAVKKYFKIFNELFHLVEKYGMKFPAHIIDRITVQQFIILKKCGVNVNSIKKLMDVDSSSSGSSSEPEIINDSDEEIHIRPQFITKAENPFLKAILPNFSDIPPLRYINALPIPSPKLPELPNFKTMSQSPVEPEEE